MTLLTMPDPGAVLTTAVILPKKIYFDELIVGAWPTLLITNSAPSSLCESLVLSARIQSLVRSFVKSVVRVFPRAGSRGQAVEYQDIFAS